MKACHRAHLSIEDNYPGNQGEFHKHKVALKVLDMQSEHGATNLLHNQTWFTLVLPKNKVSCHADARASIGPETGLSERALQANLGGNGMHLVVHLWLAFLPFTFAGHDGVRESRHVSRNAAIYPLKWKFCHIYTRRYIYIYIYARANTHEQACSICLQNVWCILRTIVRASSCCTVLAYVILYILAYVLADIGLHMSHRLTQSLRLSFAVTSLNALIQISKTEAADPDISPGKNGLYKTHTAWLLPPQKMSEERN